MATQGKEPIRFGPFEFDLHTEEISRNGQKVRLQSQPARLLGILLEKPGELVTRDELRHRIWPDDTFVDFEHSLNTSIKKLRQALDDDAARPHYIETLPKRGYRFIDTLQVATEVGELRQKEFRRKNVQFAVGATAVLSLALMGWVAWYAMRPWSTTPPQRVSQFFDEPGDVGVPAFSADGEQVVFEFTPKTQAESDIYVKQVSGGGAVKITGSPADYRCPRWSPDGKYIGYVQVAREDTGIYVIPADGGSGRKLITLHPWNGCFDWAPDGQSIAYADSPRPDIPRQLHRVRLDTFEDSLIPNGGMDGTHPQYSPDGRWISFGVALDPLAVIPAAGGSPTVLTTLQDTFNHGSGWSTDSKEIIFASLRSGQLGLWRVAAGGGKARPVLLSGDPMLPAIAPKGNRMVYLSSARPIGTVYRMDLRTKENLKPGKAAKLIHSTELDEGGQISPDGERIAFQSTRNGGYYEIWVADIDGSNPIQLTNIRGGLVGTPRWSPDGKWITFSGGGVNVINANGGIPRKLRTCLGISSWSRDGKSVYCAGPPETRWEIWKVPLDGGEPRQITTNGGVNGFESADAKYVYFTKWKSPGIFRVPVNGGAEERILDYPSAPAWAYWQLFDDGIYYLAPTKDSPEEGSFSIEFFDFSARTSQTVAVIPQTLWLLDPGFSVAPDRRWMIYRGIDRDYERHLMMVEGFDAH